MKTYRVNYGNDGSGITYKVIVDEEPEKNRYFRSHKTQGKWKKMADGTPHFKPGKEYFARQQFEEYIKKLSEEGYVEEIPQIVKDLRWARENGASIGSILSAFPLKK